MLAALSRTQSGMLLSMSSRLSDSRWKQVVRDAPLISFDLVVRRQQQILLGFRSNLPARDCWFVPGGVVRKGEPLLDAFGRITNAELGRVFNLADSTPLGVYEHFYPTNFSGDPEFGTHYVVLAQTLIVSALPELPTEQHERYCWMSEHEILSSPEVHQHVKNYFIAGGLADGWLALAGGRRCLGDPNGNYLLAASTTRMSASRS